MQLSARYYDGHVADVRAVVCSFEFEAAASAVVIREAGTLQQLDCWTAGELFPLHGRRDELRVGSSARPFGARLVFTGWADVRQALGALPGLAQQHRREAGRQLRAMALATGALISVIVAYVFGVPLIAQHVVAIVPPQWEEQLGDAVVTQIEAALRDEGGFEICDPDPDSVANRAIDRFASEVMAGTATPFAPRIQVVRSGIPNAFALPGGHSFYFSALLQQTESADEFAGVMAHELGHVAHRHGMEQLIATSATGLLIGFVLGDLTGLSIAGGVGSALIDSSFSREAEREADRFAAAASHRVGFRTSALTDLLDRVSADDDMSRALALLSTHPLTAERRKALAAFAAVPGTAGPAFTEQEWGAIKSMCDLPARGGAVSPDRLKNR